jgi:hypothetical protein
VNKRILPVGGQIDGSDQPQKGTAMAELEAHQIFEYMRQQLVQSGDIQSIRLDECDDELREVIELASAEEAQDEIALQEYLRSSDR